LTYDENSFPISVGIEYINEIISLVFSKIFSKTSGVIRFESG